MEIVVIILWLTAGVSGFIYWVTEEYDINLSALDCGMLCLASLLGPTAWVVGAAFHGGARRRRLGTSRAPKTLFKKKEEE